MANSTSILLILICTIGMAAQVSAPPDGNTLAGPAAVGEIQSLIGELSDPSYHKRALATRRLCAIGLPARPRLEAAAAGDNAETALRAQSLLGVLDGLMFAGVDVQLSLSKTRIVWDEPIDLMIRMSNRSRYPTRVPFDIPATGKSETPGDATQVATMLDLSEVLRVRRADGREVELTVDDIAADPAVVAAVQQRLNSGPARVLQPGESVTVNARAYNRGWARYRLLDAGTYSLQIEYTPVWNDEVLNAQGIGRVISKPVHLEVTRGAPENVSRRGIEASFTIKSDGDSLVVSLTNHTDQSMIVNRNFGGAVPFADGRWMIELDDLRRDVPILGKPGVSLHDFDPAGLVAVRAGAVIEMAKIGWKTLRDALRNQGIPIDETRWTVHFSYMNLCDRQWQRRQGAALLGNADGPPAFQSLLSRHILSTRHTSNQLTAPAAD